jgi:hypothetical protein
MLVMSGCKRFRSGVLPAFGTLVLVLMTGCHNNISGSYLAGDKSAVVWLQIVRTPDNHLTGQMAANILKPDGTIEQNSASITGAVDGENVTIQGSRFFGLESFVLSGMLSGNVLTLTGAQSTPLTFTRSTSDEFQARIAELNARSQSIIQAKAAAQTQLKTLETQRRFVAEIDSLIGRMERFVSEADDHSARFPGMESGYKTITAEVTEYVARERRLAGNPNAAVSRGQLSVAANQTAIQTEQKHNEIASMESSFEGNIKPRADQATAFEQQCRTVSLNSGNLTTAEIQDVNAACDRLASAVVPFRQRYAATVNGLAHLEQVYQDERGKQQQLLHTAQVLQ